MPPKKLTTFQYTKVAGLKHKFGAHVSTAGGVSNSVLNARNIGANSFALFLKSPRKWDSPPISKEEEDEFKRLCDLHGYDPKTDILPHGSYLLNLANPDSEKADKAYGGFLDDLQRCEQLGIGLYNFHPGSSLDSDHSQALKRLAGKINEAIAATSTVKIVLENMAGKGNLIGSDLQDIKDVIDMIDNKDRVGVCLDTCHAFSAGYDIRTEELFDKFIEKFDTIVGKEYLCAIHLNDSKAPFAANVDLHQKLGLGFLGLEVFRVISNHPRLEGIPIVLETPVGKDETYWGEEIKLLESMIGAKADDKVVLEKSEELAKLGEKERKEHMNKYEKKQETKKRKDIKAAAALGGVKKKAKK
ncbi:CYFA0S07e03356g1_1 [Cyberlindnera fabianii]|uniref:Apurinic-apyrimidinic endonuclease 1 n=1 Tax=Cyberlindnera fabianii TaxID=36022 RepID=A0A061B3I1_CYBFA|nr:CYFA0S07e03356g1_1 [Cyberlindnera fabianii]